MGLNELRFTSFYTERGHKLQLSASDVALGISALLEGPVSDEVDWTDNWRKAQLALSPNNWPELSSGIAYSINHQRTILSQVRACFSSRHAFIARDANATLLSLTTPCPS